MRKIWMALLLVVSLVSAVQAQTQSAAVALSQLLKGFRTYQADFSQTTFGAHGRLLDRSHGVVMMERPGRFRWETQAPTHQILITNDKQLWIYDVDLEQATQQQLSSDGNVNPAALLNGSINDLTQHFNIEAVKGRPGSFQLKPKEENRNFHAIRVSFKDGQLVGMRVYNTLDELSTFTFSNIKINMNLSPKLFDFKAPSGFDVVKE